MSNCIDLRSYLTESCSHAHDFAQLVLPVSGSMELELGHCSGVINGATGVYIAPNEHHCFAGSDQNQFIVMDVSYKNDNQSTIFKLTPNTQKLIHFTQHYLAHNERDFFTDSLIHQLLFQVAVNPFTGEPDPIVSKTKRWIDLHFQQAVDVKKVAKHAHLSVSQLQRRFKQKTGCGIGEYWRMKKLQHAKQLLSQNKFSIEAIAFEVGYENLSAFSRRFTQVFGESPSQWRTRAFSAKKCPLTDNSFHFHS